MIKRIFKTAIATAFIPVGVIVDVCTLPATAYDNKQPFKNTTCLIKSAKSNIKKIIS